MISFKNKHLLDFNGQSDTFNCLKIKKFLACARFPVKMEHFVAFNGPNANFKYLKFLNFLASVGFRQTLFIKATWQGEDLEGRKLCGMEYLEEFWKLYTASWCSFRIDLARGYLG